MVVFAGTNCWAGRVCAASVRGEIGPAVRADRDGAVSFPAVAGLAGVGACGLVGMISGADTGSGRDAGGSTALAAVANGLLSTLIGGVAAGSAAGGCCAAAAGVAGFAAGCALAGGSFGGSGFRTEGAVMGDVMKVGAGRLGVNGLLDAGLVGAGFTLGAGA